MAPFGLDILYPKYLARGNDLEGVRGGGLAENSASPIHTVVRRVPADDSRKRGGGAKVRTGHLPPVWLAAFVVLVWIASWIAPLRWAPLQIAGGVLVLVALALMAGAVVQMLAARTTVIPRRDPSRLLTGGIFAMSRNPIYLADAVLLGGLCLYWAAPWAAPLLVPAFIALINRRFIGAEEERLAALYGPAFRRYESQTRRWI